MCSMCRCEFGFVVRSILDSPSFACIRSWLLATLASPARMCSDWFSSISKITMQNEKLGCAVAKPCKASQSLLTTQSSH